MAIDKFESIRAFTKVVEAGGFAAAAREMGLSRSVVNKYVIQTGKRSRYAITTTQYPAGHADRNRSCLLRSLSADSERVGRSDFCSHRVTGKAHR